MDEKDTKVTETKKETQKSEETITVPPKDLGLQNNAKTQIGKTLTFLAEKFLTPPVIAVFVTALIGPLAIQWVNDGFENKKLQEKVIQTVLNYTSAADFSKPESIEKIGIIAQMVDENQDVFGLKFEETNKAISRLDQATADVGIKNLNKKLAEANANLTDFKTKLNADSAIYTDIILQKDRLTKELESAKKQNDRTKINSIESQIAKSDLDMKEIENSRNFYREQIRYWSEQQVLLNKDIEAASADLANVLAKNRDDEKMLTQEKEVLKTELAKQLNDASLMKFKITELEEKIRLMHDSIEVLKIKKKKVK